MSVRYDITVMSTNYVETPYWNLCLEVPLSQVHGRAGFCGVVTPPQRMQYRPKGLHVSAESYEHRRQVWNVPTSLP